MNIIKDDSFRQNKDHKEFYNDFCQRAEKYSGGIRIFDAAEQFYRNYFGLVYSYDNNSIRCISIDYNSLNIHLNGKRLDKIILSLINEHEMNFLPAAIISIKYVFKRIILINERGDFYLDDGTYLGSDYEKIVSDILTNKTEIAPMINSGIFTSLERHGFNADKIIDTAPYEDAFTKRGHKFFKAAREFFEVIPVGKYIRWKAGYANDFLYIGCFPERRIKNNPESKNMIGEELLNIASTRDNNYYISESGKYYAETSSSHYEIFHVTDDVYTFVQYMLIN